MVTEKANEKRKCERFRVKENVFAALRSEGYKVGLVRDLSEGGLAFEYIDDDGVALDTGEVDVYTMGGKYHVKRIPCKVIYKKDVPRDSQMAQFATFAMTRCGVKFDEIDPAQKEELEQVINSYIQ